MNSISNINVSWPYESPLRKELGEHLRGQRGTGKRSVSIPSSCWENQWKADTTQSPENSNCRVWFLFEKNIDNLTHWCNPLIPEGSLVSQCSGNSQSLYNIVSEIPVQLITSYFEHGQVRFMKGSSLLEAIKLHLMISKCITMILFNYLGIPGTVLSLFHQFIGRPQEVKLLVTSASWVHHVLPDCCYLKPEPSETSQCLPNEDFWKCLLTSEYSRCGLAFVRSEREVL